MGSSKYNLSGIHSQAHYCLEGFYGSDGGCTLIIWKSLGPQLFCNDLRSTLNCYQINYHVIIFCVYRVKSVGYDMLKQRGGWQSTGRRPTDFSLEFDNFFSHEVEDMIDLLEESSLPEDKARRQLCSIFQASIYML